MNHCQLIEERIYSAKKPTIIQMYFVTVRKEKQNHCFCFCFRFNRRKKNLLWIFSETYL